MGSCFTDNIGACMASDLMDVCVNPFGPLYNPLSIRRAVKLITGEISLSDRLCTCEGRVHSFDAHSRLSGKDEQTVSAALKRSVEGARYSLEQASAVIITLGTTRCFTLRADGEPVANCHKQPASAFTERFLSIGEITDCLCDIIADIARLNPSARVIFTVSPLRYPGADAHINTVAKATLHLAIAETGAEYFPAWEIMMDDLRDYRFYADDMRHPSAPAIEYIYSIFSQSYYSAKTIALAERCRRLTRRLGHRAESRPDLSTLPEATVFSEHPFLKERIHDFI